MNDVELEALVRDGLAQAYPLQTAQSAIPLDHRGSVSRRVFAIAAAVVLCAGLAIGAAVISNRGPHRAPLAVVGTTATPAIGELVGRFWVLEQISGSHGMVTAAEHPTLRSHGTDGAWLQFSSSGVLLLEDSVNVWNNSYTQTTDGLFIEAGAVSAVGMGPGAPSWVQIALGAMDAVANGPTTVRAGVNGDQLVLRTKDGYVLTFRADGSAPESGLLGSNDDYDSAKPQPSPVDAVRGKCRPGDVLGVDGLVHIPPVAGETVHVRWTSGTVHTAVVESRANGFVAIACG